MRFFKCKCGENTAWSSMGTPRCFACEKCGSDLAEGPNGHREPQPHNYSASVEQMGVDGPVTVPVCCWCREPRWKIEKQAGPTP